MNLKIGNQIRYITQKGDGSGRPMEVGVKIQTVEVMDVKPFNGIPEHVSGLKPRSADFIGKLENGTFRFLTYRGVLENLSSPGKLLSIKFKC